MSEKPNHISAAKLTDFAAAMLTAGGFSAPESKAMAQSLVLSETLGHGSHGVIRVKEYLNMLKKGMLATGAQLQIVKETPNSLTADGGASPGQVVMPVLLEKLYAKLSGQAVVTAAVRNCGHVGRIGEWVEHAAYAGYAGLLMVNGNGQFMHVAPPGGKQGVTDTNPIAFAIPLADKKIFVTDMSTSAVAFGKVRVARMNDKPLPPGCLQDADGIPTTDPEALFTDPHGSLLPMGGAQGYKGFALAMFIDLLASGLSGGQMPPAAPGTKGVNNFSLTLWNPKFFAGLETMQSEAKKYLASIRASPPIDPKKPIRLPGDRMNAVKADCEREGIPLNAGLVEDLSSLAQKLGVAVPSELKV